MIALLVRHGHTDAVGQWLAGRREGVPLNASGRREAAALSHALRWLPITAVYSSPLERAVDTATPVARDHGLGICPREAFTEIDFGEWTGKRLDALEGDPEWRRFNADRTRACPPGGEALAAVQRRVVEELLAASRSHPGEMVVIVTHAEPIRCAIAWLEGLTLDAALEVEISPASVTAVGLGSGVRRLLSVNVPAEEAAVC